VQPWSGWPAEWATPNWNGQVAALTDTAWLCVDLNASILASLPPYLVGAADTLNADWLRNPDPDMYSSWDEFAKQLFWEFQLGEVFVLASARYSTGWPARFYVVPGWTVDVDFGRDGRRRYKVGDEDVTADILHLRYTSTVDDTHGHGPLEAGAGRVVAAQMLSRYGAQLASNGGIPSSILRHPEELTADQAMDLQAQWVQARISAIGEPAVLSGGVMWEATQLSPKDMALLELSQWNESRIAVLLGVPPFIVGLPSGGDAMTYSNVTSLFDYHWRAGLRPKAEMVMNGLSAWALPRGTRVELNRDAYIAPEPLVRAQIAATLHAIQDPLGNPAITVDEIRAGMRIDDVVQAEEAAPTTGGMLG
jgi:HK97 family phage portal protein